jgi:hypothetical protein
VVSSQSVEYKMHGVKRPEGAGREEDKSELLVHLHRKYILALQEKRVSSTYPLLESHWSLNKKDVFSNLLKS